MTIDTHKVIKKQKLKRFLILRKNDLCSQNENYCRYAPACSACPAPFPLCSSRAHFRPFVPTMHIARPQFWTGEPSYQMDRGIADKRLLQKFITFECRWEKKV